MTKSGIPEAAGKGVPGVVERWLRSESSDRWLLIIENIDNEDVIFQKRNHGKISNEIEYYKLKTYVRSGF
jgi:hypothetical protein